MAAPRDQFADQGFVIVNELLGGDDLRELDSMADQLLDGMLTPDLAYDGEVPAEFYTFWEPDMKHREDIPRRLRVRLMSWMCYHHSWFWSFAQHEKICGVMTDLFDNDVQIFGDTVFMKPPRHGIEAAAHQDTAFWPRLDPKAVLFWMAIDPATVSNGCLDIIPSSHHSDIPHHADPVQKWVLHEDQADFSKQIPVELAPGSAILQHAHPSQLSQPQ